MSAHLATHLLTLLSLLQAMSAVAPRGVRVGCRSIVEGDENHLMSEERRVIGSHDVGVRRASGAARHVARELLAELGRPRAPIGRARFGAPIWPQGIVGSLAHDDETAVAAVASSVAVRSLGIDVEPAEPLPDDIYTLVVSGADLPGTTEPRLAGRLLFAAKEAVYKAVHPLDGLILNYDDIAIDLAANAATTRTGHVAQLYYGLAPRVTVLAVVPHDRKS